MIKMALPYHSFISWKLGPLTIYSYGLFVAIAFLAGIFLDGIIFPAFLGFRESFLTIIFLVVIILYHEVSLTSLVIGVVLSALAEFYWGLKLGTLILPLLASAGAFSLLNKFFNVKSRVLMIFSGVIMFIIFWWTSIIVTKIL